MPREVESKFFVDDLDSLKTRLVALGAVGSGPRFERNRVYDTASGDLRQKGQLLRLRHDGRVTLTFKRPVCEPALAGVKVMEEVETRLENFQAMARILESLGYRPFLDYEKCREVWRLRNAVICLDILPFGRYVEIESTPEGIAETAALLGLDMAQASSATYHDLYRQHLRKAGLPEADSFVFDEARRVELLRLSGLEG